MRAKFGVLQQTQGVRLRAKFRLDRFILSPSGGEKPQFLPYFGLRHSVVSPIGSNLRKLSTDAQLLTFPLSNGIKIISVLHCLHGDIVERSDCSSSRGCCRCTCSRLVLSLISVALPGQDEPRRGSAPVFMLRAHPVSTKLCLG